MATKIANMEFKLQPDGSYRAWVGAYVLLTKAEVQQVDAIAEVQQVGDRGRILTHVMTKYFNPQIETKSIVRLTTFADDAAKAMAHVKVNPTDPKDKRFVSVAQVMAGVKELPKEAVSTPTAEPKAAEPTAADQVAALTKGRKSA